MSNIILPSDPIVFVAIGNGTRTAISRNLLSPG